MTAKMPYPNNEKIQDAYTLYICAHLGFFACGKRLVGYLIYGYTNFKVIIGKELSFLSQYIFP